MKIAQINATCGKGSTGKICMAISKLLQSRGIENTILYSLGESEYPLGIQCSNVAYIRRQALKARVFGTWGFHSKKATEKIIAELEKMQPDIVHLHNLHGHDCHLEMLFSYFKEKGTKLVWTFHDCWAFTAYCPHFDMIGCEQWKTGCRQCPQKKEFSWFFDKSSALYQRKKALFSGLNLTIVTPSQWLAGLVKQSFLREYPVQVIHNGIDVKTFSPRESDFRQKYGLEGKKILLGVAFGWDERKGLDVFIELSRRLRGEYKIVLVGTDEQVEKNLPKDILSIRRTQNQTELAEIYTAADLLVNPTREENYPTVNMEAIACGTPVVTFRTGGSPEIVGACGAVVEKDDIDGLEREITRICSGKPYAAACVEASSQFDENARYQEYLALYHTLNKV